jgi:putative heme iron utilization protein
MSSSATALPRQHASTAPQGPQLPEPSHAERVRTLAGARAVGTLATASARHAGYPFGSLMPYALDGRGRPLFLISNMAMHTHNLKKDGRASLFVEQASADGDPLGAARATLVGDVAAVPEAEIAGVRELYLARHENSRYWVDFADFAFFRLEPVEVLRRRVRRDGVGCAGRLRAG